MANTIAGIAPQLDTHANWVSLNPTLGLDADGKSYGQVIFSTGSPVGDILIWGNAQAYNDAYAAGQYAVLGSQPPSGSVEAFAGSTLPSGWLECDGSAVSRTTYSALFSAIGTTWGTGDGSTTFNLPDFRGLALEGTGTNGSAQDAAGNNYAGAALGAVKKDQMQGHWHKRIRDVGTASGSFRFTGTTDGAGTETDDLQINYVKDPITDTANGTPRTGTYTTGPRAGVKYMIKA